MKNISKRAQKGLFALFITSFLTSFNPISSHNTSLKQDYCVFFDLGDVLLETNKAKAFFKSPGVYIKNVFKHGIPNSVSVTSRLFEMMDHVTKLPRSTATATCDNLAMPQIMADWLCGFISSKDFVDIITNISPNDPFFKSKAEGELLLNAARLMLPKQLVKINKTTKTLNVFLQCCKHDASRVCILSNWDKSSIQILKKQFPEIFSKIKDEQILFSGDLGCKKPDAAIYYLAAKKMGLASHRCILVDDQVTNILGASRCGWKTILHNDANSTAELLHDLYGFNINV
jgi:HAD superfamily hydrolase (TIGR01549 family)